MTIVVFDKNGYKERKVEFRLYTFKELQGLLKQARFGIHAVYVDFKKQPFSVDSPRMIVVVRKA